MIRPQGRDEAKSAIRGHVAQIVSFSLGRQRELYRSNPSVEKSCVQYRA